MSLRRLTIIVVLLTGAVSLALTNPTMDDYLRFVDREMTKALDKMDPNTPSREQQFLRQVFRSQGKQLLETVVRPQTVRHNWGLLSRYRTRVSGTEVVVVGVAGTFIPVRGLEEATLSLGRMAF